MPTAPDGNSYLPHAGELELELRGRAGKRRRHWPRYILGEVTRRDGISRCAASAVGAIKNISLKHKANCRLPQRGISSLDLCQKLLPFGTAGNFCKRILMVGSTIPPHRAWAFPPPTKHRERERTTRAPPQWCVQCLPSFFCHPFQWGGGGTVKWIERAKTYNTF